ncbi:glycosyltransferase family 39 protein [Hydrogenivirga sp. 128-5-R1-1]|uniref:ArnT family glycosyltransferase n=1 Tax=Hydrogenivirga sp. 128-5-R1-1 TaxID=392423 RepID=UPI00015F37FC|nr:glycosyltransferase family 39 protein [Hydrogenivirga sp. 128-5-R1-1]EDP76522.1 hypothetical protein HG1285_02908 [Hydrogenivirga sp. 128-5-R1-1]
MLPNLNNYQFRGEEALRTIVAYEMDKGDNLFQPTFLGEPYYNKPPLFNWLILASSKVIPWSEMTARSVTLTALLVSLLITFALALKITSNVETSLLASLILISFSDVLFWYGYLAEIDMTLTAINTLSVSLLLIGVRDDKPIMIYAAGIAIGFSFLLKGLPSYAFWFLSVLAVLVIYKPGRVTLRSIFIATFVSIIIPAVWLLNTQDPYAYAQTLFRETVAKVKGDSSPVSLIKHVVSYPLLNFKQLLPASLFVLVLFIKGKNTITLNRDIKALTLIALLNYLPYLASVNAKGRYVLPLFPLLAVLFAFLLHNKEKFKKIFVATVLVLALLRLIFGFVGLPILERQRGPIKDTAYAISQLVKDSGKIACDCRSDERKAVCLYLDFITGEFIKSSRLTPNWRYLVSCDPINTNAGTEELLKAHIRKENYVWLYLKRSQDQRR